MVGASLGRWVVFVVRYVGWCIIGDLAADIVSVRWLCFVLLLFLAAQR